MKIGKLLIAKYVVEAAPKNTVQDWYNYYVNKWTTNMGIVPEGWADNFYFSNAENGGIMLTPSDNSLLRTIGELFNEGLQKYVQWVVEHAAQDKRMPEDVEQIIGLLKKFEAIKPTGKVNKDIQSYPSASSLQMALQPYMQEVDREQYYLPEGREKERLKEVEDYMDMGNIAGHRVIAIYTVKGASELCRHTEWCVRDPRWSEGYLDQGPLFLILEGRYKYVLIHFPSMQAKDVDDNPIDWKTGQKLLPVFEELAHIQNYNTDQVFEEDFKVFNNVDRIAERGNPEEVLDLFNWFYDIKGGERIPKLEDILERNDNTLILGNADFQILTNYLANSKDKNWPWLENKVGDAVERVLGIESFASITEQTLQEYIEEVGFSDVVAEKLKNEANNPKVNMGLLMRELSSFYRGLKGYILSNQRPFKEGDRKVLLTLFHNEYEERFYFKEDGKRFFSEVKQYVGKSLEISGLIPTLNKWESFQQEMAGIIEEYKRGH